MNLLTDSLLTVRAASEDLRVSLPDLLALLLNTDKVSAFPRLPAEQRSYWWRFLVRCAARGLRTASIDVRSLPRTQPDTLSQLIRDALLQHANESDWDLYHPDPDCPAFLQPQTPEGKPPDQEKYKRNSAALLTAVIGTKEHERKSGVGRALDPESLIYALVEYQGGVVFGGRGNYETQFTGSRTGAGSGTPFMGAWIDGSPSKSFRHDVNVLLDRWEEIATILQGEIWALWARRWDGITPIPASALDPAFIPFARMIRLDRPRSGHFDTVWFRASEGSRVADPTQGGNLGDPFVPLIPDPAGGHLKVRGTLAKGYDYKEVVRLLLPKDAEDAVRAPSVTAAIEFPPDTDDLRVIFEGMAFEQGKTRGFHRRVVRLPAKAVKSGLLGYRSAPVHEAHEQMLIYTGVAKKALRAALAIVLTGDPRARDDDRKKMVTVTNRVEEEVDRQYLSFLFTSADLDADTDRTLQYRQWLYEKLTNEILPEALGSLPRSQGRRWDEEVSAEAYLRGRLRRDLHLPRPAVSKEVAA